MFLVPKTPYGEILWAEKFEVDSLEDFAETKNAGLSDHFPKGYSVPRLYTITSPRCVEFREPSGKLRESYHACKETGCQLI